MFPQHHSHITHQTHPQTPLLTLEPLRQEGQTSLDTTGIPGLEKITLREIEIRSDNFCHDVTIKRSADLFDCACSPNAKRSPIPETGDLARAMFDLHLKDSARPHALTIEPPNFLALEFPSDASRIEPWLQKHAFRLPANLALAALTAILALVTASPGAPDDETEDDQTNPVATLRGR